MEMMMMMMMPLAVADARFASPAPSVSRPKSLGKDVARSTCRSFKMRPWHRPTKEELSSSVNPLKSRLPSMNGRSSLQSPATSNSNSEGTSKMAVLLEVEGVVADVHKFGHRSGFNLAFQEFNLECANWSEPVYADLLRHAGGAEDAMLRAFFDRIGWPSSLPTNENDGFVRNIMKAKQRALEKLASSGDLPLRPGFIDWWECMNAVHFCQLWFVDEVLEAKVPLVILAAYSKSGEVVARSLIAQLGPERAKDISVVGEVEVKSSSYGQVVLGAGVVAGLDEQLAMEAAKAVAAEKQRVATEVANKLGVSVDINTSASKTSRENIAALRAGAEAAAVAMDQCILLAGAQTGPLVASRIGMPCVVVRSSATSRAEFPTAKAVLEGFGPGDITLARLRQYLK